MEPVERVFAMSLKMMVLSPGSQTVGDCDTPAGSCDATGRCETCRGWGRGLNFRGMVCSVKSLQSPVILMGAVISFSFDRALAEKE